MSSESLGFQIESWVCYGMPEAITPEQRAAITDYALSFEECGATREELSGYSDHDLIQAAYGAMADYAKGQM